MKPTRVGVVRALRAVNGAVDSRKPCVSGPRAQQPAVVEQTKTRLPAIYEKRAQRVEQHESPVQVAYAREGHHAQPVSIQRTAAAPAAISAPLGTLSDEQLEQVLRQQIQDQKRVPKFRKASPEIAREARISEVTCITESSAAIHIEKNSQESVRLFYSTNQGAQMSFLVETTASCVAVTNLPPATTVSVVVVPCASQQGGSRKRSMVHFHTHSAEAPASKQVEICKSREYNDALQRYFAAANAGRVPKAKSPYA